MDNIKTKIVIIGTSPVFRDTMTKLLTEHIILGKDINEFIPFDNTYSNLIINEECDKFIKNKEFIDNRLNIDFKTTLDKGNNLHELLMSKHKRVYPKTSIWDIETFPNSILVTKIKRKYKKYKFIKQ